MSAAPDAHAAAVRAEYARQAADYDRRWARYVADSVDATLARLPLAPGDRLLDVGCGTGALAAAARARVPGVAAFGVDLSVEMVALARARLGPAVPLAAGDAARLPFAANAFDVAASSSVLHYWADPLAGLREVARVLRPGGRLALTDWCGDYLAGRVRDLVLRRTDPAHRRTYTARECARLLADAGFAVASVERYRISWTWGLMTAVATRGDAR